MNSLFDISLATFTAHKIIGRRGVTAYIYSSSLGTCGVNLFDYENRLRFRKFLFSDYNSDCENFYFSTPISTPKNSEVVYWKWATSKVFYYRKTGSDNTQKDELTNGWKPAQSHWSDIKLFYLFYKAKNWKMNEKIWQE